MSNTRVIIIDDDRLSTTITRLMLKVSLHKPEIITFTDPTEGLQFIESEYCERVVEKPAIVLLDINMPVMTGWEFLERFDALDVKTEMIILYVLSSSADPRDKQRSYANKNVRDHLVNRSLQTS